MPDPYSRRPALARKEWDFNPHQKMLADLGLIPETPAEAAQRVTRAETRSANRSSGGMASIQDLLGPLQSMVGGMNSYVPDIAALKAQLRRSIAAQYNPMMEILQGDMSGAKDRAEDARESIGDLYADLSSYYEGQVEPTQQRNKKRKASASHNAKALQQSITNDYSQRLQQQMDMYKSLGIEAATPAATQNQQADQANAVAMARNIGAAAKAALETQSNADESYWSEGAGIAKSEGAEQQADVTQELQRYLNQQNKALAALKGEKEAAYQKGLLSMNQQAAESASKSQSQLWDRLMDLARLRLSAAGSGGSGSGSEGPGEGLTGAVNFLADSGQAGLADTFQEYIRAAQVWGNSPQGKLYYGGQPPNSPEEWAQVVKDHAANKGLPPSAQIMLWQAALRYYGRE